MNRRLDDAKGSARYGYGLIRQVIHTRICRYLSTPHELILHNTPQCGTNTRLIRRSKCQASQSRLSIIDQQHETGPDPMIQIKGRELSESDLMILIHSRLVSRRYLVFSPKGLAINDRRDIESAVCIHWHGCLMHRCS